jgi:hypothetical protein
MKLFTSRPAIALAAAAALSMTATPAMARHWHRDRGIDAGDVFAGLIIIGGIAAVAAAASKSNREKRERERDYRYPDSDYRSDDRDYRYPERDDRYHYPDRRYGDDRRGTEPYSGSYRGDSSMDGAVNICTAEVERGRESVDTVESVSRDDDGWRVDGRTERGGDFSCTVGRDGRIERVTVDGRAMI